MAATQPSHTPRALARTLCNQIDKFFERRIVSALESAADELAAQSPVDENVEWGDADDTQQREVATIRETAARAARSFCKGLVADVERELLFAEEQSRASTESARKRRSLPSNGLEVSLLSDEELELSVMVSTVGSRFERRNRETLERLVGPVGRGCGEAKAERLRTLLGVFGLINRFSGLLSGMALSVPTRSRLMNAFQFHVLEELKDFYLPLAEGLEGVPVRHGPGAAAGAAGAPAGLDGWVRLLGQGGAGAAQPERSGYAGGVVVPMGRRVGGHGTRGAASPGISHDDLLDSLTALPECEATLGEAAPMRSLYDQVVVGLERQRGLAPSQLPAMDLNVLRLVSLFFETFLGDEVLPTALRFLVGRLQLPVLRLALSDGSFFDEHDHPARQLIQTLCRLGVGWSSDLAWVERSPAYQEARQIVDDILDQANPDAAPFAAATERLEALHADRQEKADRVEGRVVELEVGRAKLRAAKIVVQDALNEHLRRHRNLVPLQWFFSDAWSKVLVFVCLRHGCQSEDWEAAMAICTELAEVLTPAGSKVESKERFSRVPNLLERLESFMVEAGFSSSAVDQNIERLYAEIDRIRESEDDWFADAGEMVIEQQQDLEPITLIPVPPPRPVDSELPEWLCPGAWIRVHDAEDPGRYQQVKVAARVSDTSEILLVDERGARWGIWNESEFLAAVDEGRVVPVAHEDVVQKTLDAMIAQLTRGGRRPGIVTGDGSP